MNNPYKQTTYVFLSSSSLSNTCSVLHLLDRNLLDCSFTRILAPFELDKIKKYNLFNYCDFWFPDCILRSSLAKWKDWDWSNHDGIASWGDKKNGGKRLRDLEKASAHFENDSGWRGKMIETEAETS
jgi:hypothetical protein